MADVISDPNSTGITLYVYTHIPNALISLASVSLGFAIQSRMKTFNAFLLLKKKQQQQKIKTQQIIFKKQPNKYSLEKQAGMRADCQALVSASGGLFLPQGFPGEPN